MFGAPISKNSVTSAPPATTDPQFNYVTALFNGDGTNGAQNNTFLDSSTNNFTITRNGTPTQGSAAPFGPNWSNYFNGTSDALQIAHNTNQWIGASVNFTIECWICLPASVTGERCILNKGYQSSPAYAEYLLVIGNSATMKLEFLASTSGGGWEIDILDPNVLVAGVWYHVAVVRNGSTITMYKNGVSVGTPVTNSNALYNHTGAIRIGANTSSSFFSGYVSNARVVIGTAVYTSAFTPPTIPLTAITNTNWLTCQSTYFKDNSTNNFTLTTSGTPSVQRFSPFLNTASYSPSVYGGSMYFNGSTDWLVSPSNSALTLTGNFTLEAWIYVPSGTTSCGIISTYVSTATVGVLLSLTSGTTLSFRVGTDSVSNIVSDTVAITYNTWIHVAAVRNGTTLTLYKNGVSVGTPATTVYTPTTTTTTIGKYYTDYAGFLFTGYISNARMLNGTALYTSNFTPPTAPLTAITNTSLLLSGTNAGIYDSAMITTEITAGSAQISTTQKKYGTGSLYFTGTGAFLQAPNSPNYAFGTGALTIECWIYTSAYANATLVDTRSTTSSTTGTTFGVTSSGQVIFNGYSPAGTFPLNTWTYLTVALDSGLFGRVWIDGVYKGGSAFSGTSTDQFLTIGNSVARSGTGFLGYIDDLRITKGYARYTSSANFTPPTQSLPTS